MNARRSAYVAVSCPGAGPAATDRVLALAEELGAELSNAGAIVLCGGLGGAMEALARGVQGSGGVCVGLLPGTSRAEASPDLSLALPTGLGQARNALLATACGSLVAVGRGHGTLSELALALRSGKPSFTLESWDIEGAQAVSEPRDAALLATAAAAAQR